MTRRDDPHDPVAGYELRRHYCRVAVESSLRTALWWFAAIHGICLAMVGLLVLDVPHDAAGTLGSSACLWCLSLIMAAVAAGIALWNWSLLRRSRRVLGLAPWGVLVAEITLAVVGLRL